MTFPAQEGTTAPQRGANHPEVDEKHENPDGQQPETPTGDGGGENQDGGGAGSGPVNIDIILERFERGAIIRLKPKTIKQYSARARNFARDVNLERYSKQQLSGSTGKKVILDYLNKHPKKSWRFLLSMLETVYAFAGLIWPINRKTDIPKLPAVEREESPPDDIIRKWSEAMKKEPDVRLRLIWLFIAQHGWRPSQACLIKWRNIRYDGNRPIAIVADGGVEDFKTSSPVAARLSPDVAETLIEYSGKNPHTPEQTILSIKGFLKGKKREDNGPQPKTTVVFHPMDHKNVLDIFTRLMNRWNLPRLRPKDLRHWVCTQCRKVDMSKPASAYLLGHNAASGQAMRDWYDNPQKSEVFDEQSAKLPNGPLGLLEIPKVEIIQGFPSETLELLKGYMDGKLGLMDFMSKLEAARMKQTTKPELTL